MTCPSPAAWILVLVLSLAAPGCGTVLNLISGEPRPFGGVIIDGPLATVGWADGKVAWLAPFALIDLPLSLALDTLTLAYTGPRYLIARAKADHYQSPPELPQPELVRTYEDWPPPEPRPPRAAPRER